MRIDNNKRKKKSRKRVNIKCILIRGEKKKEFE